MKTRSKSVQILTETLSVSMPVFLARTNTHINKEHLKGCLASGVSVGCVLSKKI